MFLVKGDVSGIQDFIFNVNSKGAARSLKGRSFFIKILLEVAMQKVFDACNITTEEEKEATKVSTSGGNFILQLPVVTTETIDAIQLSLSTALRYTGLNIMLQCEEIEEGYKEAFTRLNQKIRKRKYELLMGETSFFEPFDRSKISGVNANNRWIQITSQLKNKSHFAVNKDNEKDTDELVIGGKHIYLAGYQVSFGDQGIAIDKYLESVSPTGKTFEELAKWGGVDNNPK